METINVTPADGAYTSEMLQLKQLLENLVRLAHDDRYSEETIAKVISRQEQSIRFIMAELLARDIIYKATKGDRKVTRKA